MDNQQLPPNNATPQPPGAPNNNIQPQIIQPMGTGSVQPPMQPAAQQSIPQPTPLSAQQPFQPQPSLPVTAPPPTMTPLQPMGGANFQPFSQPAKPKKRKAFAIVGIAGLALLLIGGGSAAAYFGVYVPNKPENRVLASLEKSLAQEQTTTKGTADFKQTGGTFAAKATFTTKADSAKKAFALETEVTAAGVNFPIETRLVENSVYFKLGDLATLTGMVKLISPDYAKLVDQAASKISNQWVSVDSTLMGDTGLNCAWDVKTTSADIKMLAEANKTNGFATIKSAGKQTIDNTPTDKFTVSLDMSKTDQIDKTLNNLPSIKKMNECVSKAASTEQSGNNSKKKDTEMKIDNKELAQTKPEISLWIGKDKLIKQIELKISDKEASAEIKSTIDYGPVTIEKPKDAKPVMQLLTEILPLLYSVSPEAAVGLPQLLQ